MDELVSEVLEEADEVRQLMVIEVGAVLARLEPDDRHHRARLVIDLMQDLLLCPNLDQHAVEALLDLLPLFALPCS